GCLAEGVSDGGAAAVRAGGAFHLVGGGGRPQGEAGGQRADVRGCGVGCGPTRGGFCSAHRRVPVSRCTCPSWLWVGVCPQYRARKLTCGSESTVTPLPWGSITKRVRRRVTGLVMIVGSGALVFGAPSTVIAESPYRVTSGSTA